VLCHINIDGFNSPFPFGLFPQGKISSEATAVILPLGRCPKDRGGIKGKNLK